MPQDQTGPQRSKATTGGSSGHSVHRQAGPKLDRVVQGHIGKKLQTFYGSLAGEPVPDRFEELLNRLQANEAPRRSRA